MTSGEKRALKVFLCHASSDKPQVRTFYKHLAVEGVDAWLDQEKLLPGQDWRVEIPRAVKEADVVVVFLSHNSITKEGYIQKEIKFALDVAEEKPDGTIFLIPARLEDCPVPDKLSRWQWVNLFDENGYVKLLSSLKLRADIVGAVITPSAYEDDDAETERRLDQYYTEGLAAFYTEDWGRACQRFQLILSERPGDKNAIEKFEEAERQRDLSKLYVQSMDACRAEDWQVAIKALDELLKKSPNYRDSVELFRNAKKQKQLKELYAEARKLHAAKKWDAVLKVFEQISAIEQSYPDPDEILPSAQKEAAELKRLSDLNKLYSQAVREMDLDKWYEARTLLERVHKSQTGFLETENLLRKIEDEILKIEKINERNNQINTLYEQAHGLLRSKNWRNALDKIEEIQKLDNQFEDKDGIVEKAKAELGREEQKVQRQNQLAAMYTDAVRLLKDGKYQESFEKWNEVKAIDPKYPDRQGLQRIVRRKIAEAEARSKGKLHAIKGRFVWMGIAGFMFITFVITLQFADGFGVFWGSVTPTPSSPPTLPSSPTPFTSYFWGFDTGLENWDKDYYDITLPLAEEGYLTFKIFGIDPYIFSPGKLHILAETTPIITVRMHITQGSYGAIYFITDTDNKWDEGKKVIFDIKHSETFQVYNIRMSSISAWKGVITQLRLDPFDDEELNTKVEKVEIDYISIHAP